MLFGSWLGMCKVQGPHLEMAILLAEQVAHAKTQHAFVFFLCPPRLNQETSLCWFYLN